MKKVLLVIMALICAPNIFAFQIQRSEEKILLKASDCQEANQVATDLKTWIESLDAKPNKCLLKNEKINGESGKCVVDVSSCLPEHVLKYQNTNPSFAGPNCWNLALVMKGVLPSMRYTTPEEMHFYMGSPLCEKIGDQEKPKAGDIGAVRSMINENSEEQHGFIYISEKVAYSKNGYGKDKPYALQPLENVFKIYEKEINRQCRNMVPSVSNTSCVMYVNYYRCISMDQYLEKNKDLPVKLVNTLKELKSFEKCTQEAAMSDRLIPGTATKNMLNTLQALSVYLQDEAQHPINPQDEKKKFLLGSLLFRLDSMTAQLQFGEYKFITAQMTDLQKAIYASVQQLYQKKSN